MKGDFTRDTFDPVRHFSRVLMQQGRVQLDADWNEQVSIFLHYIQTLTADVIGPHGGPSDGFRIEPLTVPNVQHDFLIIGGHYYVNGILCELEDAAVLVTPYSSNTSNQVRISRWLADAGEFEKSQYFQVAGSPPVALQGQIVDVYPAESLLTLDVDISQNPQIPDPALLRGLTTYLTQPDYPLPPNTTLPANQYLVYLDVWERHISHLEDTSDVNIREIALGGPDTATRAKVVWQVKVLAATSGQTLTCDDVTTLPRLSAAALCARARQDEQPTDPCLMPPDARYRGAENQLYRVEIHTGNIDHEGNLVTNATPTFKWSRENGSVVFPIVASVATADGKTTVPLGHCGYDDKLGLYEGAWVEIVDDDYVLHHRAEPLLRVSAIDRDQRIVTLDGTPYSQVGRHLDKHPLLRRWDHEVGVTPQGVLLIRDTPGEFGSPWLALEDGVQIQFQPNGRYRSGDYWVIPARTATGDVEWPHLVDVHSQNLVPKPLLPHGVAHSYAPLAVIEVDTGGIVQVLSRCRRPFTSLSVAAAPEL